jgi:hypothetical protein
MFAATITAPELSDTTPARLPFTVDSPVTWLDAELNERKRMQKKAKEREAQVIAHLTHQHS